MFGMTKTQYYTATSVDGFIADLDNSLAWLFQVGAGDEQAEAHEDRFAPFIADVGALCMGSTTYEWVLAHDKLLENPEKWHAYYGDRPCWVFTHRDLPAIPGVNMTFVKGDVAEVHQQMVHAAGGKNIWIIGGGDLVGQFADHGLLDEIMLSMAPVTLGAGAPLLPRRLLSTELKLSKVEHNAYFVFLTYQVISPSRRTASPRSGLPAES